MSTDLGLQVPGCVTLLLFRCPLNCDHRLFYLCSNGKKFVHVADKRIIRQEGKLFVPGPLYPISK